MEQRKAKDAQASPHDPSDLRRMLKRLDAIHREMARSVERINYLHQSAMRANNRMTPVYRGTGSERSRVEYAVLEADAVRWGAEELKRERKALLALIRPLVESLPPGLLRSVATQRILDGVPCGVIAKRLNYSRCYIYRLLDIATERLCKLYERQGF